MLFGCNADTDANRAMRTARETSKRQTLRNKGPFFFSPLLPVGSQELVLKVRKGGQFHAVIRVTTKCCDSGGQGPLGRRAVSWRNFCDTESLMKRYGFIADNSKESIGGQGDVRERELDNQSRQDSRLESRARSQSKLWGSGKPEVSGHVSHDAAAIQMFFYRNSLGQESCRTKVSRIFRYSVPNFAPNFAPNFPRIFRGLFALRFVGDGDQKKFTENPRHFSKQNSQADTKKRFTKFFWRAGKVRILVIEVSEMGCDR